MKANEPDIKIFSTDDPKQYEDDRKFWNAQTTEYKLMALETIRFHWFKFRNKDASQLPRLRRVLRIIERNRHLSRSNLPGTTSELE